MSTYTPAKRRTIRRVIQSKLADWMTTLPPNLVVEIKDDIIVTGGSIVSLLMGEKINDFDIYFRTKEATIAVAKHYAEKNDVEVRVVEEVNILGETETRVINFVQSAGVVVTDDEENVDPDAELLDNAGVSRDFTSETPVKEKPKYRVQFISRNAITLSDKMQIVTRFYGDPKEIHRSFDFAHCMGYYDSGSRELNLPGEALEAMLSKTLIYRGSLYPIASIFRMKKFVERGWRIGAGELFKMCCQISNIDLKDVDTLVDQLTGADMAYFYCLIKQLSRHKAAGGTIDNSYIIELIDVIFNS